MNTIVIQDYSVEEFIKATGDMLYKNEASNSLMLGICDSLLKSNKSNDNFFLYRVLEDDHIKSAAIHTPPYPLVITYSNEVQLEHLANFIFDKGLDLPGVVGPSDETINFTKIWSRITSCHSSLGMDQIIYQVSNVVLPQTIGRLKVAVEEDTVLTAKWLFEFSQESLPVSEKITYEEALKGAKSAIEQKMAYFWTIDEIPVSVAHWGRPTKNGVSIRAVYTPNELRGHGHGSAVVAHLSQMLLNSTYKFCFLYTDAANSTSNKIYKDIGYQEVQDSKHFLFTSK